MKSQPLIIIHVGGALATLAVVVSVAWYAFADPETASGQLHQLSREVKELNEDLMRLHAVLDQQSNRQRKLLEAAQRLGRLPSKSPIDRDLKKISALASANGVKLLEVAPTSTVRYPNVLELRYRVKAEGVYADQLGFLADFERSAFWADVTYLRLAQRTKDQDGSDPIRQSEITVSFFSAFQ